MGTRLVAAGSGGGMGVEGVGDDGDGSGLGGLGERERNGEGDASRAISAITCPVSHAQTGSLGPVLLRLVRIWQTSRLIEGLILQVRPLPLTTGRAALPWPMAIEILSGFLGDMAFYIILTRKSKMEFSGPATDSHLRS